MPYPVSPGTTVDSIGGGGSAVVGGEGGGGAGGRGLQEPRRVAWEAGRADEEPEGEDADQKQGQEGGAEEGAGGGGANGVQAVRAEIFAVVTAVRIAAAGAALGGFVVAEIAVHS